MTRASIKSSCPDGRVLQQQVLKHRRQIDELQERITTLERAIILLATDPQLEPTHGTPMRTGATMIR